MKQYFYPNEEELNRVLSRTTEKFNVVDSVESILRRIKTDGDQGVIELTKQIDNIELTELQIIDLTSSEELVNDPLKLAIAVAKENIEKFHAAQIHQEVRVETMKGVECWQKAVAINRIGIYIPSGSAPLFSTVLMLAIPAKIAGVKEIIMCTPSPSAEILYTAALCGVDKIYRIGGAMAIGAMAYGTETVPKVDKIFGPGNQYVTCAKQLVSLYDVAIDMPAGPSEVMILADSSADPVFVAADLLSQAEHGTDSQAIVITNEPRLAAEINVAFKNQLRALSRPIGECSLIVVKNESEMIEICNRYAPEHLIISMWNAEEVADQINSAGSIFLGNYTPESAGDYASGTNHTLPTCGWARSHSGVNLDSFTKKITYQRITPEGLRNLGATIETMAEGEGLEAHKNAVSLRLKNL